MYMIEKITQFKTLRNDILHVYDGTSEFDTEISAFTGDIASEIMSSGPDIFLRFLSDGSETKNWFYTSVRARYTLR